MIVDLVRNDLSHSAQVNSVEVEELHGLYSFATVHQLISTVISTLRKGAAIEDVISDSFPMGSMTGAPKISAMQLIEEFENFKRGIYSGTVGYLAPAAFFLLSFMLVNASFAQKTQLNKVKKEANTKNSLLFTNGARQLEQWS